MCKAVKKRCLYTISLFVVAQFFFHALLFENFIRLAIHMMLCSVGYIVIRTSGFVLKFPNKCVYVFDKSVGQQKSFGTGTLPTKVDVRNQPILFNAHINIQADENFGTKVLEKNTYKTERNVQRSKPRVGKPFSRRAALTI